VGSEQGYAIPQGRLRYDPLWAYFYGYSSELGTTVDDLELVVVADGSERRGYCIDEVLAGHGPCDVKGWVYAPLDRGDGRMLVIWNR
jgi:hypothetical protein